MLYGLLDEIRRLHDEKQTGILAINGNDEHVEIFFREGLIEAATSNMAAHRLGGYLVKAGHVSERDIETVGTEAHRQNVTFGEAVVRKGLVEQGQLGAAVRSQAIE